MSVLLLSSQKNLVEFYSSKILKLSKRNPFENEFVNFCQTNNVRVFIAEIRNRQPSHALQVNPIFQNSLESSLISFFSDSGPFTGKRHEHVKRNYLNICSGVYDKTIEILELEKTINRVFVPNGRMADQKTFLIASKHQKIDIEVKYFEKGYVSNSYYIGQQSLLDRLALQSVINKSDFSSSLSIASTFFSSRKVDEKSNEFIMGWKDNKFSENLDLATRRVTFFNSSNDEFMSLGSDWNDSNWISQWEAFEQVAKYFLDEGYSITFRLHPNGANKSKRERSRERRALDSFAKKFPLIKIYRPRDKVNSYKLIQQSDVVVVWNSTIGLEASYMGKPVVCLNASEWDLSIQNMRVRDVTDLNNLSKTISKVDPIAALRYVAGRISLDEPLKSNYFRNFARNLEDNDPFFRLARVAAGSRRLKIRNFAKVFFASNSGPIYRFLKRISSKIRVL